MEIPVHKRRFVLLAALDAYGKVLAKAKKANEEAHCSNKSVDENLVILEALKAEYETAGSQAGLDLAGTPMGEAMTAAHYRDDDGTDLSADALDDWMRRVAGCYVPIAVVSEWVLEKRKLVSAWLRGIEKNVVETRDAWKADPTTELVDGELPQAKVREILDDAQRVGRTCAPDFIDVSWFTPPTPVEPPKMTEAEVDEWVSKGPWGVTDYHDSDVKPKGEATQPGVEWELVKRGGDGEIIDRSDFVYDNLEESRHEAAVRNRNLAEAAAVPAVDAGAEPAAPLHPEE